MEKLLLKKKMLNAFLNRLSGSSPPPAGDASPTPSSSITNNKKNPPMPTPMPMPPSSSLASKPSDINPHPPTNKWDRLQSDFKTVEEQLTKQREMHAFHLNRMAAEERKKIEHHFKTTMDGIELKQKQNTTHYTQTQNVLQKQAKDIQQWRQHQLDVVHQKLTSTLGPLSKKPNGQFNTSFPTKAGLRIDDKSEVAPTIKNNTLPISIATRPTTTAPKTLLAPPVTLPQPQPLPPPNPQPTQPPHQFTLPPPSTLYCREPLLEQWFEIVLKKTPIEIVAETIESLCTKAIEQRKTPPPDALWKRIPNTRFFNVRNRFTSTKTRIDREPEQQQLNDGEERPMLFLSAASPESQQEENKN